MFSEQLAQFLRDWVESVATMASFDAEFWAVFKLVKRGSFSSLLDVGAIAEWEVEVLSDCIQLLESWSDRTDLHESCMTVHFV